MVETSFQIRHAERTERPIVAQSELRGLRPRLSGGQVAGSEPLGLSQELVVARLRGKRSQGGTVAQGPHPPGETLEVRDEDGRPGYESFPGRSALPLLSTSVMLLRHVNRVESLCHFIE